MDEASLGAGVLLLPLGTGLAGVFGVLACVSLVYELRERRPARVGDTRADGAGPLLSHGCY